MKSSVISERLTRRSASGMDPVKLIINRRRDRNDRSPTGECHHNSDSWSLYSPIVNVEFCNECCIPFRSTQPTIKEECWWSGFMRGGCIGVNGELREFPPPFEERGGNEI